MGLVARVRSLLERRLFGLTADEIRYTFEDVRKELRATRAELQKDIADIRRDLDRLATRSAPLHGAVPGLRGEGEDSFDPLPQRERGQGEGA
jgi:hypothetical protein